jgi:NitT/TauT family transport system substrate-binding protein
MAYKKVTMEKPSPFNGLDWIVARDEGLLEKEGLNVEFIDHGTPTETDLSLTNAWNQVSSARGHAEAAERGAANMFNACEWGNYRRSQDSTVGALQIGRRACTPCGAIVVPPWSDIYTPQQLANRTIAVPFHAGTHYLALQMLEGFVPRDMVKVVSSGGKVKRYRSMMNGTVDACTVTEPWNTVADKAGCRVIVQAFYNGTDVATPDIDTETYAAINRALSQAVRRLNADKRKYVHYFIDLDPAEEVKALTVNDFNLNRLVYIEPGTPIPDDELERTYNWMVSWNLIGNGLCADDLVNTRVAAMADD